MSAPICYLLRRPLCWVIRHDWVDFEVGEHWVTSSVVTSDYVTFCQRCGIEDKP